MHDSLSQNLPLSSYPFIANHVVLSPLHLSPFIPLPSFHLQRSLSRERPFPLLFYFAPEPGFDLQSSSSLPLTGFVLMAPVVSISRLFFPWRNCSIDGYKRSRRVSWSRNGFKSRSLPSPLIRPHSFHEDSARDSSTTRA